MGSRAHYVVKSDGSWSRYYTRWGGHAMELDLLAGPGTATRFARGQARPAVVPLSVSSKAGPVTADL